MSANKKHLNLYSENGMTYTLDGANAMGKPRRYHQRLFSFWSVIVILLASIGIVYLMHLTGVVGFVLQLVVKV